MFRNHASQYSTGLFHGTGRSIQTSMALPCMPYICLPCVCIALSCLVLVCVLPCPCMYCLVFSGSEDAISGASQRTLLAPPWASILLGIRCFATMPHRAPQGFSMVLAVPSRHLWLCLRCLLCLAYAFYALHCLLFSSSEDVISRASLRALLAPPWASILLGIRCFATMPHRAPQGFSMVLAGPSRQLWLCLLCLAYALHCLLCLALPSV